MQNCIVTFCLCKYSNPAISRHSKTIENKGPVSFGKSKKNILPFLQKLQNVFQILLLLFKIFLIFTSNISLKNNNNTFQKILIFENIRKFDFVSILFLKNCAVKNSVLQQKLILSKLFRLSKFEKTKNSANIFYLFELIYDVASNEM